MREMLRMLVMLLESDLEGSSYGKQELKELKAKYRDFEDMLSNPLAEEHQAKLPKEIQDELLKRRREAELCQLRIARWEGRQIGYKTGVKAAIRFIEKAMEDSKKRRGLRFEDR